MVFRDREDAAHRLADALAAWHGQHPLVLGIPRGGVCLASVIAQRLAGQCDAILVKKLRAPTNPELAMGTVDEQGVTHILPFAAEAGATFSYLRQEAAHQLALLRRRRAAYDAQRKAIDVTGRAVIVTDDGMATGATMLGALSAVRARRPAMLVCAVPVAAPRALTAVRALADQTVCLYASDDFDGVSQCYIRFDQVDDAEVIALLR